MARRIAAWPEDWLTRTIHRIATQRVWGPRCREYEPGCPCCEHWKEHDWLFSGRKDDA